MKAVLTAANEQLQQALMDKTLESAAALDALRQQQTQQLAAVRRDHQMVVDQMKADAAATAQQHSQVGSRWGNNSLVSTFKHFTMLRLKQHYISFQPCILRNQHTDFQW